MVVHYERLSLLSYQYFITNLAVRRCIEELHLNISIVCLEPHLSQPQSIDVGLISRNVEMVRNFLQFISLGLHCILNYWLQSWSVADSLEVVTSPFSTLISNRRSFLMLHRAHVGLHRYCCLCEEFTQ